GFLIHTIQKAPRSTAWGFLLWLLGNVFPLLSLLENPIAQTVTGLLFLLFVYKFWSLLENKA
ncbi:hypothetical protein, partial [Nostoc sp.]|uniref:hypothetical protein n=1 Tax=Nostoc sp. TaxID=1180 RepID=UPI002FF7A8E8